MKNKADVILLTLKKFFPTRLLTANIYIILKFSEKVWLSKFENRE